jgi:hypothetical protein
LQKGGVKEREKGGDRVLKVFFAAILGAGGFIGNISCPDKSQPDGTPAPDRSRLLLTQALPTF